MLLGMPTFALNAVFGKEISFHLIYLCYAWKNLSHLIMLAVNEGDWRTNRLDRHGIMVSHLMFVDDLFLFEEATMKHMKCVISILQAFCSMLGQEVNNEKTSIVLSNNATRETDNKLLQISNFKFQICYSLWQILRSAY